MGLRVEQQKAVPLIYGTVKLECGFRADLVVDSRVVVELKCKEALHPVDHAQVLSHLRLLGLQVGLLINFHVVVLKDGVRKIVNHYDENPESQSARRKSAEDAEKICHSARPCQRPLDSRALNRHSKHLESPALQQRP
jgi:GxxExxY protein